MAENGMKSEDIAVWVALLEVAVTISLNLLVSRNPVARGFQTSLTIIVKMKAISRLQRVLVRLVFITTANQAVSV